MEADLSFYSRYGKLRDFTAEEAREARARAGMAAAPPDQLPQSGINQGAVDGEKESVKDMWKRAHVQEVCA